MLAAALLGTLILKLPKLTKVWYGCPYLEETFPRFFNDCLNLSI